MSKKRELQILLLFLSSTLLTGCGFFSEASDVDPFATAAYLAPPTATATEVPPTATPSPTLVPCNLAAFVRDVSISDGADLRPGEEFTKTWRLQNMGSCAWTESYDLVFVRGDRMQADIVVQLQDAVRPGAIVDLSVEMTAPEKEGRYRGYWMLRTNAGHSFGLGQAGDQAFWVLIDVARPSFKSAYQFSESVCDAVWRSGAGELDCPGSNDDARGFVATLEDPAVEGRQEDEPALLTHPEWIDDGWISGEYPRFEIKDGDRFHAAIGCLEGAPSCNVSFQLDVATKNTVVETLGAWDEVYDGKIRVIDLDLSPYAGKKVNFILRVGTNGASDYDWAFWLNPQILRVK